MTKTFSAEGIDQQVADWRGTTTDPSLPTGVVADLGSWLLRANGSTEGEIFEKFTQATATSWARNNLTLKVFNVKNFGAVGNGVTNDTPAIQAAINAAVAAGGGTIYFPPAPLGYAVVKIANNSTFLIENSRDLDFVGDGKVSFIKMTGSAGFGDWRCFTIRNFSTRINFYNLFLDASTVTDPDPGEQLHFIQFQGLAAQAAGSGAKDCEVVGCFFGSIDGDGVRTGAEATKEVENIRVRCNVFDMTDARSCVGMQRYSREMNISYNYMLGVSDQEIDYEPTGGGGNRTDVILGNICMHQGHATAAITVGGEGAVTPILDTQLTYNIVHQGGYILPSSVSGIVIEGNIVEAVDASFANAAIFIRSLNAKIIVAGNVFVTNNVVVPKVPVLVTADADGPTTELQFCDNIVRAKLGNACVIADTCNRTLMSGNIFLLAPDVAGTAVNVSFRSGLIVLDQCLVVGNLAVNLNAGLAAFRYAASPADVKNTTFNGNFGVNPGAACFRWDRGAFQLFLGFRYCGVNTAIGGTSSSFDLPATNVGATFAGSAGLGVQQAGVSVLAGPEGLVTTPSGSLVTNYLGANATTIWIKETGVGNTGYFALGGWDFVWGAADAVAGTITALFMAPGDSLAVATATELRIPLPRDCRIRNLRIFQTPGTGGGTITYTARINGGNTTLTTTINVIAASGSNLANSRACVAGEQLSVAITKSAPATTSPTNIRVVIEII